jgi:hypothetical protein
VTATTQPSDAAWNAVSCATCHGLLQQRVAFCPFCGTKVAVAPIEKAVAKAADATTSPAPEIRPQPPQMIAPSGPQTHPAPPVAPRPPSPSQKEAVHAVAAAPARANSPIPTKIAAPSPKRSWSGIGWLIAIALAILIFALKEMKTISVPSVQSQTQSQPQSATILTRYVVRNDAPVHDGATSQSKSRGPIARGTEVHGFLVTNKTGFEWFQMTDGAYAGKYVWEKNLLATRPPPFKLQVEDDMAVKQDARVYTSPDPNAQAVGDVHAGESVYVAGQIDDNWYEIHLVRGGVGYVPAVAF